MSCAWGSKKGPVYGAFYLVNFDKFIRALTFENVLRVGLEGLVADLTSHEAKSCAYAHYFGIESILALVHTRII